MTDEDAERAVLEVAEQDPAKASEFGYLAYDEAEQPIGEFVSGAELLARREAPAWSARAALRRTPAKRRRTPVSSLPG